MAWFSALMWEKASNGVPLFGSLRCQSRQLGKVVLGRCVVGLGFFGGRRGREAPWAHDYPRADVHFMRILDEVTLLAPRMDGGRERPCFTAGFDVQRRERRAVRDGGDGLLPRQDREVALPHLRERLNAFRRHRRRQRENSQHQRAEPAGRAHRYRQSRRRGRRGYR